MSCAVYARFITLPDIPFVSDQLVFWSGVVVNAIWHALLRPAAARRKVERDRAVLPSTAGETP